MVMIVVVMTRVMMAVMIMGWWGLSIMTMTVVMTG